MTTVLDAEREVLELDTIPEYLSDNQTHLPSREAAVSMTSRVFTDREARPLAAAVEREPFRTPHAAFEPEAPKSDELEALWPGVHNEFLHAPRRSASFYLTIGFMAGAFISLLGVFGYSAVSTLVAHNDSGDKQRITVANGTAGKQQNPVAVKAQDGSDVWVPSSTSYQVQPGDTLAGIALKNYKKASPRLLDEICRANNMRNANVLSLGQKLNLPEYHSQPAQVAGAGQIQ